MEGVVMIGAPNPGVRPSQLQLARYVTGELTGTERVAIEALLDQDPDSRAAVEELRAASSAAPAVDVAALRARAQAVPLERPTTPEPANRAWVVSLLALAAALLLAILASPTLGPEAGVRLRGITDLDVYVMEDRAGRLVPEVWGGQPLAAGAQLAFAPIAPGAEGVVLLSVDGGGAWSVHFPSAGSTPQPMPRQGVLPNTLVLDAAPGPEVFIAVFDRSVGDARSEAASIWARGGLEGLNAWADREAGVVVVAVAKESP
jgi:hypothetical protein